MRISVVRIRSSKRAISVVFIYLSFSFAYILLESSENIVYNFGEIEGYARHVSICCRTIVMRTSVVDRAHSPSLVYNSIIEIEAPRCHCRLENCAAWTCRIFSRYVNYLLIVFYLHNYSSSFRTLLFDYYAFLIIFFSNSSIIFSLFIYLTVRITE